MFRAYLESYPNGEPSSQIAQRSRSTRSTRSQGGAEDRSQRVVIPAVLERADGGRGRGAPISPCSPWPTQTSAPGRPRRRNDWTPSPRGAAVDEITEQGAWRRDWYRVALAGGVGGYCFRAGCYAGRRATLRRRSNSHVGRRAVMPRFGQVRTAGPARDRCALARTAIDERVGR